MRLSTNNATYQGHREPCMMSTGPDCRLGKANAHAGIHKADYIGTSVPTCTSVLQWWSSQSSVFSLQSSVFSLQSSVFNFKHDKSISWCIHNALLNFWDLFSSHLPPSHIPTPYSNRDNRQQPGTERKHLKCHRLLYAPHDEQTA